MAGRHSTLVYREFSRRYCKSYKPEPIWTLSLKANEFTYLNSTKMIDYTVRKILVPTDFSEHAKHALSLAAEISADTDAEFTLLTVVNYPG